MSTSTKRIYGAPGTTEPGAWALIPQYNWLEVHPGLAPPLREYWDCYYGFGAYEHVPEHERIAVGRLLIRYCKS